MKGESEKYKQVLNLLKDSKPVLDSTEEIELEIIRKISSQRKKKFDMSEAIDFLFGWVYIGWVRRSLITASVLLVLFFIYQQGIILKQINFLSRQIMVTEGGAGNFRDQQVEQLLMMYKKTGRILPSRTITISEKQMKELLESVNELQAKYKDLEKLLDEDPELKQLIEKKLTENNRKKIKL